MFSLQMVWPSRLDDNRNFSASHQPDYNLISEEARLGPTGGVKWFHDDGWLLPLLQGLGRHLGE